MHIQRVDDGGAFVERFGYCRALRAGNMIFVSGTTADDHGASQGGQNAMAGRGGARPGGSARAS